MIWRHRIRKILIPDQAPPRYAQAILQARCNGGKYEEPDRHKQRWSRGWPKGWLSRRMEELRGK